MAAKFRVHVETAQTWQPEIQHDDIWMLAMLQRFERIEAVIDDRHVKASGQKNVSVKLARSFVVFDETNGRGGAPRRR